MARTTYIEIPFGYESIYENTLSASDRFQNVSVRRVQLFSARRRKKGMSEKSLLPILLPVWNGFSAGVRTAWSSAGAVCKLSGLNLFIKDSALRLVNGLSGYATPNDVYQALVGRVSVQSPATGCTIAQLHPESYWIRKKVVGKKAMYDPVVVQENFSLPLEIQISYKSTLASAGASAFAKFF